VPVPGQLLPVQEHHEIRQDRVAVGAAIADLAHQVHAHGVAAEGEEGAVAEAEDTEVTPNQVHRYRQQGVTQVFTQQGDGIGADIQGAVFRHEQVQRADHNQGGEEHAQENLGGAFLQGSC